MKFGFRVSRSGVMGDYWVTLPIQPGADAWYVVGNDSDGEMYEAAVARLIAFIAEAQGALDAIRRNEETRSTSATPGVAGPPKETS